MSHGSCLASTWCESIRMVQPSAGLSKPKPMSALRTKPAMRHGGEPHGRRSCSARRGMLMFTSFTVSITCSILSRSKRIFPPLYSSAREPVRGIDLMKKRRRTQEPRQLASGPGKLCEAFAIDRTLNGSDLCGSVLYLRDNGDATTDIIARPRIGVDYAGKWKHKPWRFLIRGNPFVSKL